MTPHQQLVEIAHGPNAARAFAGFCNVCGRGMFRQRHTEIGKEHKWIRMGNVGECETCKGHRLGVTPAPLMVTTCADCGCAMRGKNDPHDPAKRLRHTKTLCRPCYRKSTKGRIPTDCKFTHCTVCEREFGSIGSFGGVVRLAEVGKGICWACSQRLMQQRKRERIGGNGPTASRPLAKFM